MTGEEIVEILLKAELDMYYLTEDCKLKLEESYEDDFEESEEEHLTKEKTFNNLIKNLGKFEKVRQWVDEDDRSKEYIVYHFFEDDVYILQIGYYDSYGGDVHWNGEFKNKEFKQVFPKEVVRTIYE